LTHAAAAFYPSPFERAAIAVIDGAGNRVSSDEESQEMEVVSLGEGAGNQIELSLERAGRRRISTCYWRYVTADSLGAFYNVVTEFLGFGAFGEGKTMGLAPYGDLSLLPAMGDFARTENGWFVFDPYSGITDWLLATIKKAGNAFRVRANLAAAAQSIFEEGIFAALEESHRRTGSSNLCYGGGCALNSVANGKIREKTSFERVFIYPATGDNGTAIGAALHSYYTRSGAPRSVPDETGLAGTAYTGRSYSNDRIRAALDTFPVDFRAHERVWEEAAWLLSRNKVIGWFQGSSEIGPRALGNRSILASALEPGMRNYINMSVKNRETFRPLAPAVPIEDASRYFDIDQPSPFMLMVRPVRHEHRRLLHAVTHIDGSARVQTVDESGNPSFYRLLQAFGRETGHPVLLNTSFNRGGEPIVETPEDALEAFIDLPLDALVLGDYLVEKHTPWIGEQ
jgi:carbamoyltransferase